MNKTLEKWVIRVLVFYNNQKRRMKYADIVKKNYHRYLHYLYRKATHIKGLKAGQTELAAQINVCMWEFAISSSMTVCIL